MAEKRRMPKKKKIIIAVIIVIAVIAIAVLAIKAYLGIHLLLGNDVIIRLTSDKENLFLKHGESDNIRFDIYVTTNPYCTANCSYSFRDLSSDKTIEKSSFSSNATGSFLKEYVLNADTKGVGQDLYRFDIECKAAKTQLCETTEELKTRSLLITLNYDLNDEEKSLKNDSKEKITLLMQGINYMSLDLENVNSVIVDLNKTVDADFFIAGIDNLSKEISALNETNYAMKETWEGLDWPGAEKINESGQKIVSLGDEFKKINETLSANVSLYNTLIENLTVLKQNLTAMKQINVTNTVEIKINNAITDFNDALDTFSQRDTLAHKKRLVKDISEEINSISTAPGTETPCCFANGTINDLNASKIEMNATNYTDIALEFKEPIAMCCFFGECEECCDEACRNDSSTFPVIFLHGHAFNRAVSAEYSLDTFQSIQKKLDKEGYVSAGSILINPSDNSSQGIWGETRHPITVKASYYFDVYKNTEESVVIQTKLDTLDTYALRLREIIDIVKYKTGRDKVILVTHSTGGVVARRYMQIFGDGSVAKLIMIASPNKGIDSAVLKICPIFGAELECRDLDKNSLFMNKLNYGEIPEIPVYNIIGDKCIMDNETGDGIVKKNSAYLEWAENYVVNGTCDDSKFIFLHGQMLDPGKYPKVYRKVREFLAE